jgi:hypothetical protein
MRGQTQSMHSNLIPLSALSTVVLLPIFALHSVNFTQTTEKERQNIPECMFTRVWPDVWSVLGSLLSWDSLRQLLLASSTGLDIGIERGGY